MRSFLPLREHLEPISLDEMFHEGLVLAHPRPSALHPQISQRCEPFVVLLDSVLVEHVSETGGVGAAADPPRGLQHDEVLVVLGEDEGGVHAGQPCTCHDVLALLFH